MNKKYLSVLIIISGILVSGAITGFANAETGTQVDIQYPIPELGNCTSKNDCKKFCDSSVNSDACLAFGVQHKLMSSEEVTRAKKFKNNGNVGPGGCKGQDACEQYCGDSTHMKECVNFAKKNGMMSDQQLQESEKVLTAIENGIKPPACSGPKQCSVYCSNPEHMEECMTFSIAAGIMPEGQKVQMEKTLEAIKQGAKPPACQPTPPPDQAEKMLPGQTDEPVQPGQGLESCDTYCSIHSEECMSFALATGSVPEDQKEQMQKSLKAIKQGIKPPACRPKPPTNPDQSNQTNQNQPTKQKDQPDQFGKDVEDCEQYCSASSHVEECVNFSVAMGNMTAEQAQSAIKNGNKGPGGCVGKNECNAFCNKPENEETCYNFAKDNGMIPKEDLQKMQRGQSNQQSQPWANMCKPDGNGNPTALACVGEDGNFVMSAKVGEDGKPVCPEGSSAKCGDYEQENQRGGNQQGQFKQNQNRQGQSEPNQGGTDQGIFSDGLKEGDCGTGPGTCFGIGPDDIKPGGNKGGGPNQGQGFNPGSGQNGNGQGLNRGGQQMPQQAGPGGCKGPEECQKYCASNPEVCKNFQPQKNQQGQQDQRGQQIQKQQPRSPNQQQGQQNQQGQGFNPGSNQNGNGPGINQDNTNQGIFSPGLKAGDCGTGPGTCFGIGPDDRNPEQFNQPGQMQPVQQPNQFDQGQPAPMQQQFQPQSPVPMPQQEPATPPPPVSSMMFDQALMKMMANIASVLSPQDNQ